MTARVEVFVQLKPGMLDPQGETVRHALDALGYEGVSDVRIGKWITFEVADGSGAAVEERVDEMCRRLLANPVIERYEYRVTEPES